MNKKILFLLGAGSIIGTSCGAKYATPDELANIKLIMQQGNNHQAYKMLRELVDKYKPDYDLVSLHVQAGLAVQDMDGLQEFYKGNSEWDLYGQGMWQGATNDYDASIASFQKALLINPTAAELHYRLGVVYLEAGHFSDAVKSFQQAEHYGCQNPKLAIRQAMALVGLKDFNGAMDFLVKGVKTNLSREDLASYIEYSFSVVSKRRNITPHEMDSILPILAELGKADVTVEEALLPLQNLLQRFPESSLLHAALGLYYFKNHEDAKGTAAIERAISYDPNDPYPPLILGEFLLDGQNASAAFKFLQQAQKANPLDARSAEDLLKCARMLNDRQTEYDMLNMLSYLKPLEIEYISQLGNYNQHEGKLELAASYYEKVLQQDKNNLPALYGLASIYWEQARVCNQNGDRKTYIAKARDYLNLLLKIAPEHPQGNSLKKAIENYNE